MEHLRTTGTSRTTIYRANKVCNTCILGILGEKTERRRNIWINNGPEISKIKDRKQTRDPWSSENTKQNKHQGHT